MATGELAPVLKQRFFDLNGVPLAGGLLTTYAAGTTTPLATYTDSTEATPNANPVVLDSQGYCNLWMAASNYKFVLTDSLSNAILTVDNVQSIAGKITTALNTFQANILAGLYTRIVGTAAQVTAGIATDSTIAGAISACVAGNSILILAGTYTENPNIAIKLTIQGTGENCNIAGSITFASGSDYSYLRGIRTTQSITLNSAVSGVIVTEVFLASGMTFVDNSTGSMVSGIQET